MCSACDEYDDEDHWDDDDYFYNEDFGYLCDTEGHFWHHSYDKLGNISYTSCTECGIVENLQIDTKTRNCRKND